MNSGTIKPIIITNQDARFEGLDGDCACPAPVRQVGRVIVAADSTWQVAPGLYRAELVDGHELFFNQLGTVGLAVLNKPAAAILDAFRTAGALDENPEMAATAHELAALGMLVEAGKPLRLSAPIAETLTAWLHVTNQCNLACDYCYVARNQERMDLETGKKAIDAIVRSALSHQFKRVKIKYTGGEASLQMDLVEQLQQYALEQTGKANLELDGLVLSNGTGLAARVIEQMLANQLRVSISLDGIGASHDIQRRTRSGQGSFGMIEAALERLERYGLKPSITITLTARNAAMLPKTVRYLLARKLQFSINFYRENDCSAGETDLKFDDLQLTRALEAAFLELEANPPEFNLLGSLMDRARADMNHEKSCGVGDSYLVFDTQGRIAKCHMQMDMPVTDAAERDPLAWARADRLGIINLAVDAKESCHACEWRYVCGGGCPVLTWRTMGRVDARSPNCDIYKAIIPQVLRLEALRLLKRQAVN